MTIYPAPPPPFPHYAILKLIVVQIRGEFMFNESEHTAIADPGFGKGGPEIFAENSSECVTA